MKHEDAYLELNVGRWGSRQQRPLVSSEVDESPPYQWMADEEGQALAEQQALGEGQGHSLASGRGWLLDEHVCRVQMLWERCGKHQQIYW